MEWEIVMGLEVHTELATKTKIFCGCSTEFGGEPNTHVCGNLLRHARNTSASQQKSCGVCRENRHSNKLHDYSK